MSHAPIKPRPMRHELSARPGGQSFARWDTEGDRLLLSVGVGAVMHTELTVPQALALAAGIRDAALRAAGQAVAIEFLAGEAATQELSRP
ncbi:hypothetical protein UFOVP707_3 [uncultured Caudovirales phage]|uniref:Uncharacterized protein n=1 Tax=uncultured Caudovirales phage TaxID=2100421 RepID=A0A6J5NLX1_9CAUD|nr:hypothetical protein UFOVP707_3 [uncultured Caudovirales phage]